MMINIDIEQSLKNKEESSKDEQTFVLNREATFCKDIQADLVNDCASSTCSKHSQQLVNSIFETVKTLEKSLTAGHQEDFKLRIVLERQAVQLQELHMSLDVEKQRTQRLIELARGVNYTDDESETDHRDCPPDRFSYDSISPMLMHQRFEELSSSYKHSRKTLSCRNNQLKQAKCDIEQLKANFDYLVEEYHDMQKRLENLCNKYLRMQQQKNQEIEMLRQALSYASECVMSTQYIIEDFNLGDNIHLARDPEIFEKFRENLQLFKNSLGSCEWIKSHLGSLQMND